MLPATFEALKAHHILTPQRQAARLMDELLSRNVADWDDVDDNAMITDEMRTALVGQDGSTDPDVIGELNELFGSLTRPMGLVNQLLDGNGHCLCTTRVPRMTKTDDGTVVVAYKSGRFVTNNAEIATEYRVGPAFQRLERTMERTSNMVHEDMRRIKGLREHLGDLIGHAHEVMDKQLPAPEEEEE
jgi:hypothetical protein